MANYTINQQRVIDSRASNLLVSASAGTGKTTVMVERIYQLIVGGEVDISNILVVTFTKLAAAEMKQRLMTKLLANSTNPIIADQLERIEQCSICTVHSFCSDIIRNYFYVVGVDPAYSIVDSITASKLQKQALDDTIQHAEQDEAFTTLYDMLAQRRKDKLLRQVITKQYEFSVTLVDYQQWYGSIRQQYLTLGDSDNHLVQLLVEDINNSTAELAMQWAHYGDLFDSMGMEPFAQACYARRVELTSNRTDIEQLIRWLALLELPPIPTMNESCFPAGIDYKSIAGEVNDFKKKTNKVLDDYAGIFGKHSWQQLADITASNVVYTDKIVQLVGEFGDRYTQLKHNRGVVDFGDLEHLALQVLGDTEALQSIRNRYHMVFVDEYQDTNSVQDSIFSAVATNGKLFAVGDIKQSIYAFRGSDPTIFLGKYHVFGTMADSEVVELNKNFRSDDRILQFANLVFGHIMTERFGKVDYKGSAMLEGAMTCSSHVPAVCIDIVPTDNSSKQEADPLYDITQPTSLEDGGEGAVISQRIRSVVGSVLTKPDGTTHKIGYGDIAILCRAFNKRVQAVYDRLVQDNIPVQSSLSADLNKGKEIRDIVSLLRVLDNATDDISLVGVCKSSIGGIDEQMLADIKVATSDTKCHFVDRLQLYIDRFDDDISSLCVRLLSLIDRLRLVSHSDTVHRVILELMDSTDYHLHVMALPNGHLRTRQLYRFVDELVGKSYNQSVDKYLQFLDSQEENKTADTVVATNAVRMMTMHSSKGLEFPVVIIVDSAKQFKFDYDKLKCDPDVGLALDHYDFDSMTSNTTVGGYCTNLKQIISAKEQEMRILYVALTRAKYHLFVVASDSKLLETSATAVMSANSYAKWIMSAVNAVDGVDCAQLGIEVTVWDNDMISPVTAGGDLLCAQSTDDSLPDSMNYVYPYSTDVPSKVVSSMLDRAQLDSSEADTVVALATYDQTPLLIGTAYHAVYEHIARHATVADIDSCISQLVAGGVVSADIASHVDSKLVYDTINNPQLAQLMQGRVYREIPFMLNTDMSDITSSESGETVILQGIIDMLVVNGDSAVVIDYKYVNSTYKLAEKYRKQLHSYKLAVERITGISKVSCYILSIRDNKIFHIV